MEAKTVLKKIENWAAVIMVAFLALYPFILMFFQKLLKIQIPDSDRVLVQFVFLFSCIAGIITWREDEHLKLSSIGNKLSKKIGEKFGEKTGSKTFSVFEFIRNFLIAVVLTAVFLSAFCQLVNPTSFSEKAWGLSFSVFYAFLPLCYFSYILMAACKKQSIVPVLIGIVVGIFISMSSITGIFYYMFDWTEDNLPALYAINNWWNNFAHIAALPVSLLLVVSSFFGVPLFIVLGGISYILFSSQGGYVDIIPLEINRIFTDRNIAAIPLFTIGGYVLAQSSAARRYVDVFKSLFGWFRGGTVVAAVIVTTFFSTFTGVSGVTILALGALLSTVLIGNGYDKEKAESLVTASGAIGLLFPPSAAIIMFATSNYFYVPDFFELFKAAILPGCLMAISMIALGIIFDRQKNRPKFSGKEALRSILNCIPELLLPIFVCLFFFKGIFDLFEVSAFTVLYAVILMTFIRKDFVFSPKEESSAENDDTKEFSEKETPKRTIFEVIASSIPISGGVLFILASASGIAYLILDAAVPQLISAFMLEHVTQPWVFLLLMNIVLLIVGCLMDMFSAILIVSPLFLETALGYGLNPVSIAVIFLLNLSIGFITPPVGMDLFISKYAFGKPLSKVIWGIFPFLLVQLFVLLLVTYVPFFTTALL